MLDVMLALLPAMIVGIWLHGLRSVFVTVAAIVSCSVLSICTVL